MEYAVTARAVTGPVRVRLTGSRAGAIGPVVAVLVLLGGSLLAGVALLMSVFPDEPRGPFALPVLFGTGMLAFAWRSAARWRTEPALWVGPQGIAVAHPDLSERLVVAPGEVSYVVWSDEGPAAMLPAPRFPVVGDDYVVRGHLWATHGASSLTLLDTSPIYRPTVAVVFRTPRDLPVPALSVLRGPLSQYPVDGSFGLLLPVTEVATVAAALDRAGIPNGLALPADRAVGLRLV